MKKLTALCVIILGGPACMAQNRIAEQIRRNFREDSNQVISLFNRQTLTPLRSHPQLSKLNGKLNRFYLPSLSQNYLDQIRRSGNSEKAGFQIDLPGLNDRKILLMRNHFTTPQLEIFTPDQHFIYPSSKLEKYYHGVVSGEQHSLVALSLGDHQVTGMVSMDKDQYFLDRLKTGSFDGTVMYNEMDVPDKKNFVCTTVDSAISKPVKFPAVLSGGGGSTTTSSCKVVRMYIECAYQMYVDHGSNIDETMDYILGVFNIASTMHRNEGINLVLSQVFIWTNPDVYQSQTRASALIALFNDRLWHQKFAHFPFKADVFEFITSTIAGGGLTGSSLLYSNTRMPSCVATSMGSYDNFPSYSVAVHVFTHESGHMLGSPHTQYCGWPGGPIDNCYQSEGVCDPGPAPIGGGTIMSYCHVTPYGINFSKGFGPLPSALMRDVVAQSTFLEDCSDTICDHVDAKNISAILTDSQLLVRWENPQGKFRVGIQPNTTSQWQYVDISNQDSVFFPRDRCEQYFKISVAAFCDAKNDFATENFISAGDSLHVEGSIFVGSNDTITLCPGSSTVLFAGSPYFPGNPGYVYEWYRNDTLITGHDSIRLSTNKPGDYSFKINYQNCLYAGDHAKLVYTKPVISLSPHIDELDVTFTNNSFCKNNYQWSFGDGTEAVGDTVVHHYNNYGNYTVCLKMTDLNGVSDSSCYNLILRQEFTDINDSLVYGSLFNVDTGRYFCRKDAYFRSENIDGQLKYSYLQYQSNTVSENNIYALPSKGTIEFEIYPKSFMVQTNWQTPFRETDTGVVMLGGLPGQFNLMISRNGGVVSHIDSIQSGTFVPASPFVHFDQWNVIGLSWGDRGVKIMANGKFVDSSAAPIIPYFSSYGNILFGYWSDQTEISRMNGAMKDIRFSFKENDFTFSAKSPWLGADSGYLAKTICYGQSFEGHDQPGRYIVTSSKTAEGCDSLYVLDLTIATELKISDSVFYTFPKGGNIQLRTEGGVPPYHYHWSDGESSANAHDLTGGVYQVTVTDSLGCSLTKTFPVVSIPDQQNRLRVFPNPSFDGKGFTVQIASSGDDDGALMFHDLLGRKILTRDIHLTNAINQIFISNFDTRGIYIISYSGKNITVKPAIFIIQN